MAVYAPVPPFAERRRNPRALSPIIAGHAVVIAAVMTAKMDLPKKIFDPPIVVQPIPVPNDPPPEPVPEQARPEPRSSVIDRPRPIVPVPGPADPLIDQRPMPIPGFEPGPIGPRVEPLPQPQPQPQPKLDPVRTGPRFATPAHAVRPPYPQSKLERGEEATLRLRLTIDENGRVTSVDPVGHADRAFLEAARRHIIAQWRYRPATEDGRPTASSTVVSLRFELND